MSATAQQQLDQARMSINRANSECKRVCHDKPELATVVISLADASTCINRAIAMLRSITELVGRGTE